MTLLSQFVDSVTGSTLPAPFQKMRIKLTVLIFAFLTLLLILNGINVSETTRAGFESVRSETFREQRIGGVMMNFETRRSEVFSEIQQQIFVNTVVLLTLLTFLVWIGLYFLLIPLAQALKEKEEFLAHTSHELLTPLAILHSELSLSAEETNISTIQKVHLEALEEIRRLQQLSNTLLNRQHDNITEISVALVVNQSWESLQTLNTAHKKLVLTGDTTIKTKTTQFYQLIYNILENAIKHGTNSDNITVHINKKEIIMSNATDTTEYTPRVGLHTCKKLAKENNIHITFGIAKGLFHTTLTLP